MMKAMMKELTITAAQFNEAIAKGRGRSERDSRALLIQEEMLKIGMKPALPYQFLVDPQGNNYFRQEVFILPGAQTFTYSGMNGEIDLNRWYRGWRYPTVIKRERDPIDNLIIGSIKDEELKPVNRKAKSNLVMAVIGLMALALIVGGMIGYLIR